MSLLPSSRNTFEKLPDEILLLICRYLSSVDILFSFYKLNSRLSQTISGYCQHISLSQIPYKRFNYICKSIVPEIGANIRSLIVSNEWTGVLSKVFLNQFGARMSSTFPSLKCLTLVAFINKSLSLFLDCLQNCSELEELRIYGLYSEFNNVSETETLLYQILSANNNRLHSVMFDDYSAAFYVNIENNDIVFSNIEKIHIELKTINDLHRLLTLLPRLKYLHTTIHEESLYLDKELLDITIVTLKHFQLQSFSHLWNFSELMSLLKRMPNVEELSIEIDSYSDVRLIDGHQIFSLLSSLPWKNFHYLLRLQDSSFIDHTNILSTWQQFDQEFVCFKNDNDDSLILYSLPFHFHNLILPCSAAKNKVFSKNYTPYVRLLYLYQVSKHISEIFSIFPKCHRLHRLCLQINENIVSKPCQQNFEWKLRHLTTITLVGSSPIDTGDFRRLLEGSPNLYILNIQDKLFHLLLQDESICRLLKENITHFSITIRSQETLQSITDSATQLASVFSSLKYLYIWVKNDYPSSESFIIAVLNQLPMWNDLISFVTVGIILKPEILTKGIHQWVLDNSSLRNNDSFTVDYFEKRFRLWF